MSKILAPISVGELLDKISILELKNRQVVDSGKLQNIRKELLELAELQKQVEVPQLLYQQLQQVNCALWQIEDELRCLEKKEDFSGRFIWLARQVYIQNDRRAKIKKEINEATGSYIVEEKIY